MKLSAATGVAVIGLGIGGILMPSVVSADEADLLKADIYSRVVEKLGLEVSPSELQSAMSEARYEARAEIVQQRLEDAIADGSITQAQADLAIEIQAAMELYREENGFEPGEFADLSREERRSAMETEREAIQAYVATEVGISVEEMEELHEVLREAGVMPNFRGPGKQHRGPDEFEAM